MPQCKFSLYLKKAGLASRNIVHFLKKVILRCIGLCFHYHQSEYIICAIFIAPGQVGQEEGFWSVKGSISQSE